MTFSRITAGVLPFLIVVGSIVTVFVFALKGPSSGVIVGFQAVAICVIWKTLRDWYVGLKRRVLSHLKLPLEKLTFISKEIGASRRADFLRAFQKIAEEQNSAHFGIAEHLSLETLKHANTAIQPIAWETFEAEEGALVNLPNNAAYLFYVHDKPFVAMLSSGNLNFDFDQEDALSTGSGWRLQIIAPSLDVANQAVSFLQERLSATSIYRGQVVRIASPQNGVNSQTIRFSKRSNTQADEIILPDELYNTVMRLVNAHIGNEDSLGKSAVTGNMGLLFHGAPGTGKTLLIRHLISCCKNYTVVIPADMAIETLRETFRLATYLSPALVVLEDVDLLAHHRNQTTNNEGLQELMNQLDGLSSASGALVLMSTNRPETIEPALSSRPGRVSQVIETPLPDAAARKRLFEKFLHSNDATRARIDHWVGRTEGASPAFLQELCKRAILLASLSKNEGTEGDQSVIMVSDSDFERAIYELVALGGPLSANVLGFPSFSSSKD